VIRILCGKAGDAERERLPAGEVGPCAATDGLMSLFQLSFPLDEDRQRQLVPALLPVEEPSVATEPEGAGACAAPV
jgi:hypothetical protein